MPKDVVPKRWEAHTERWTALAKGHDGYRDALNTPAFWVYLPIVTDLKGIDIGRDEVENLKALARPKRGDVRC